MVLDRLAILLPLGTVIVAAGLGWPGCYVFIPTSIFYLSRKHFEVGPHTIQEKVQTPIHKIISGAHCNIEVDGYLRKS